jgi:hypothetical protein
MLKSTFSQLSLATLLVAGVAASCGGNRNGGTSIRKPKDSGVTDSGNNNPNDTGVIGQDGGPQPDSGFPPPDSGFPPPDGGPQPDSGFPPPDGGVPDSGIMTCTQNNECPGGNPFCLGVDPTGTSFIQCPGTGQCGCFTGCDPFVGVVQSGCGAGEACGRAGAMAPTPGVCVPDTGGGTQGQACTSMFMGMDYQGDDCNGAQNFICHGSDSLDITGTCSRLCSTTNQALCTSLDPQSQCIAIDGATPPLGICLRPITDLGAACTSAGMCQGGHCSPEIGGQCSHQCGLTNTCPQMGGICVGIPGQLAPLCALSCTVGAAGDTMCSAINAMLICEDVGLPLCWPRCQANTDCQMPMTCNVATGHCQ